MSPSSSPSPAAAKLLLASANAATLGVLCAAAKALRDRVEVAHPVFALVFQEAAVLCSCQALCCVLGVLVAIGGDEGDAGQMWETLYFVVSNVALQFHQMTWFYVTVLRSEGQFAIYEYHARGEHGS